MKKILLILLGIFLINIVSAAEPSYIFKQNDEVDLKVSCYETDFSFCESSTTCNITILYPDNSLLIDNNEMTNNVNYFNITIPENQINVLGEYSAAASCVGTYNGFSTFNFEVTPTGTKPTTAKSLFYVISIIVSIMFLFICLFLAWSIDGENKFEMGGILEVNFNKYIKIGLAFLSYLFLILTTFFAWQISYKFLDFDFVSSLFKTIFTALWYLLIPFFLGFMTILLIKAIADIELHNMKIRGLKPR